MKPDNEIYTPEELEIVRLIENGDYRFLSPEEKEILRQQSGKQLIQLMKSQKPNKEAEMLTLEDINRMVHEIREELSS